MNLDELRAQIDTLDSTLVDTFSQRMDICRQVAAYKMEHGLPVFQGGREDEVIRRAGDRAPQELRNASMVLFKNIMDISKHLQYTEIHREQPELSCAPFIPDTAGGVVCQGTAGANSETAAKQIFGEDCKPQFMPSFADVFEAVQSGHSRFGLIPIENSTAGSVAQAYDLMGRYNFYINQSTVVEITNCLAVRPGTQFAQVREVFSHPQALQQCSEFLYANHLTPNEYSNTATAAAMVAESMEPYGAICSENCAKMHGLDILRTQISDYVPNNTRFICISKELMVPENAGRISVMLKLPHAEGTLYRLLSKFVMCGMNLLKLESRPIRNGSFEVMFCLDFSGSIHSPHVRALLAELEDSLDFFRFLGNYDEI